MGFALEPTIHSCPLAMGFSVILQSPFAELIPNPPLHKLCNTPKCDTITAPLVTPPPPPCNLVTPCNSAPAIILSKCSSNSIIPSSFSLSQLATVFNHPVKLTYQFNCTHRGTTQFSVPKEHDPLKGTSEACRP